MSDSGIGFDDIVDSFSRFSDKQNSRLNLEAIIDQVKLFGIQNAEPIMTCLDRSSNHDIIRSLKSPTFDKLWESCWCLQRLVDTGRRRRNTIVEYSDDTEEDSDEYSSSDGEWEACETRRLVKRILIESVNIFSDKVWSDYILDLPGYWFAWCNKTAMAVLQKLIPYTLPFHVWENIISYLTPKSKLHPIEVCIVGLNSNKVVYDFIRIKTVSKTERLQIFEKSLLQECIFLCSELVEMFGLLLYSQCKKVKYLSASITKTMQLFNSMMMRLEGFHNDIEASSNFGSISMVLSREYFRDMNFATNFESQEPCLINMRRLICANDEFEYNSPYFAWLEPRGEIYRLVYARKGVLSLMEPKEIAKMKWSQNDIKLIRSDDKPAIHCSGSILAVVTSERKNTTERSKFLRVWDFEIMPKNELFKYNLDGLTAFSKEKGLATEEITSIGNVGLTKNGSQITIVLSVILKSSNNCNPASTCTFVLSVDLQPSLHGSENMSPTIKQMLSDCMLIALYKKFVFAIGISERPSPMLILHDLEDDLKPLIKVQWDANNPWKVRFNCNSGNSTCIFYRKDEIQFRKLDEKLTFIREIKLSLEEYGELTNPCFQFFDNTLYGWRERDLQNKLRYPLDEQFVINLSSEESTEPLYFDSARPMTAYKPITKRFLSRIYFTGFSQSGDLQQMIFTCNSYSHRYRFVNLVTVRLFGSSQSLFRSLIPDVDILLKEHSDTRIAREEGECLNLLVAYEEQWAKAETIRQSMIAKIAALKATSMKREIQLLPKRNDNPLDLGLRRKRASKYINDRTRFDTIITRWSIVDCYGFGDVIIDHEVESVFIHSKSFMDRTSRRSLKKGSSVQFRIEWEYNMPRPTAASSTLL